MPTLSGVWVAPPPHAEEQGTPVLRKGAGAKVFVAFDFGDWDELYPAGAAIASAVVTQSPAAGLTLGSVDVSSGYRVAFTAEGGTSGVDHALTCRATLADGSILEAAGILQVR
jgi:hypothetical protein